MKPKYWLGFQHSKVCCLHGDSSYQQTRRLFWNSLWRETLFLERATEIITWLFLEPSKVEVGYSSPPHPCGQWVAWFMLNLCILSPKNLWLAQWLERTACCCQLVARRCSRQNQLVKSLMWWLGSLGGPSHSHSWLTEQDLRRMGRGPRTNWLLYWANWWRVRLEL